jgi:FkbM family methyltransferase
MKTKEKTFEISYLCGANKKIDGHFRRHRIFDRQGEVKIPKKFWMTLPDFDHNTGKVMDMSGKNVVWEDSMFSLCMENSTHHGYFTEKVLDAFLTRTVPVYWGCKDLDKYFDSRGFIKCETEDEIIEKINNLTEEDYHSRKEYIDKNFKLAQHYSDMVKRLKDWLTDLIKINEIEDSEFNGQFLEDKWIVDNIELPDDGFFVDVGGCYPRFINNTYHFEKKLNWDGVSIEPDPTYAKMLRSERKNVEEVAISPIEGNTTFKAKNVIVDDGYEGDDVIKVATAKLDDILKKHNCNEVDLLSIDLEGYEMEAWKTFDVEKYKPKLIITEHTEMGNFNDEFTKHILKDSNYRIVHQTPINFILAHSSVRFKNR